MDHFIDITIKPDAEMRENVLLNKVYSKLHKALFSLKSSDIGVSFPRYKVSLGDVIHIHGTESRLFELQNTDWLGGLTGYCEATLIQAIPNDVTYRAISRIQANMTEAKLRRLINRGSISNEEIKRYKAKMFSQGLDNPYLELESVSNGHKHRRYLVLSEQATSATSVNLTFLV
jgi:CRISPR-associated endonuclease Csy4